MEAGTSYFFQQVLYTRNPSWAPVYTVIITLPSHNRSIAYIAVTIRSMRGAILNGGELEQKPKNYKNATKIV